LGVRKQTKFLDVSIEQHPDGRGKDFVESIETTNWSPLSWISQLLFRAGACVALEYHRGLALSHPPSHPARLTIYCRPNKLA
jgi:hypothetical protein